MKNPLTGLMGVFGSPEEETGPEGSTEAEGPEGLLSDVEEARLQWLNAKAYFDHVTDPDLIDMAIYSIEAAEKRYMYLLKVARTRGVRLGPVSSH
jgi:uncharacterized UPF0146 family protein